MSTPNIKKSPVAADLKLQHLRKQIAQTYNAPAFTAMVSIEGIDRNTGNSFTTDFIFNNTDPEFVAMLNDYGARKALEALTDREIEITNDAPKDGVDVFIKLNGDWIKAARYDGIWMVTAGPNSYRYMKSGTPSHYKIINPKS